MTITLRMFSAKPVSAISDILSLLLAKTIVLGGVPTGIINDIDADKVAAIINSNGFKPITIDTEARIGRII